MKVLDGWGVSGFRVHPIVNGRAACGAEGPLSDVNHVGATRCARVACVNENQRRLAAGPFFSREVVAS